jgi:uncharacterized protein
MSRQDATLNLAQLLKHDPDLDDEVEGSGLLLPSAELQAADGIRLEAPLRWHLTVRATGGADDLIVTGEVAGEVVQECRRCLVDVRTHLQAELLYPMVFRPGRQQHASNVLSLQEREDDDDVLVFTQPEVDFASLLTQALAIELPLTVLCKEDCKGLSLDGVNLNDHPEHAQNAPQDDLPSPFSVLKDFEL